MEKSTTLPSREAGYIVHAWVNRGGTGRKVIEGGAGKSSSAGGTQLWAPVEKEINPSRRSIFEDVEADLPKKGAEDDQGRT
jgi:hypothetical protein